LAASAFVVASAAAVYRFDLAVHFVLQTVCCRCYCIDLHRLSLATSCCRYAVGHCSFCCCIICCYCYGIYWLRLLIVASAAAAAIAFDSAASVLYRVVCRDGFGRFGFVVVRRCCYCVGFRCICFCSCDQLLLLLCCFTICFVVDLLPAASAFVVVISRCRCYGICFCCISFVDASAAAAAMALASAASALVLASAPHFPPPKSDPLHNQTTP
jgi:hypothetical protein